MKIRVKTSTKGSQYKCEKWLNIPLKGSQYKCKKWLNIPLNLNNSHISYYLTIILNISKSTFMASKNTQITMQFSGKGMLQTWEAALHLIDNDIYVNKQRPTQSSAALLLTSKYSISLLEC